MQPVDPMDHFANLNYKPPLDPNPKKSRSPLLFLAIGTLACIAIIFCPPYDLTRISNNEVHACTMYAFVHSVPPPPIIAGKMLARSQYYATLAFAIIVTILCAWGSRALQQQKDEANKAGGLGCLLFLWMMMLGGVVVIGLSVCFGSQHRAVWCNDNGDEVN